MSVSCCLGYDRQQGVSMRRQLYRASVAIGLAIGACVLICGSTAGSSAPAAAATGACDAHRSEAVLVTHSIVVYGLRTPVAPTTPRTTTYYACQRPAGTSVTLGIDELGSLYGSDATTGAFVVSGTYVLAQSSSGAASLAICARYHNSRLCSAAQHWLTVVDTRTGRRARVPIYTHLSVPTIVPFPVTVALSPDGALAWLQNITVGPNVTTGLQLWASALRPSGRSGLAASPQLLDSGAIEARSLRFQGHTLYWTCADGVKHQVPLG